MGKRKNRMADMVDVFDGISRDMQKAGRRAFKGKKKKGGSRKWAKRNNRQLEQLTEQVAHLTEVLSKQARDGKPTAA
ncbi:hypothetical protein ACOBQX_08110 [Actinokineospora sp. G85]|uniref:hypothetical protein n=1 Tax=Actinokineospora sp. G85 TaxID=3406626 RepID=UPI003C78DB6D